MCITNKMENGCGLVRELDVSFFIFYFMFSAAGKEGIKWWERGSFRKQRKGDLGQGRHEVAGSLPSRLCCICSMPKTYGFSCFVLQCFIHRQKCTAFSLSLKKKKKRKENYRN